MNTDGIIRITTNKETRIIEKELSYRIVGLLFEIHTELGGKFPEKVYQAALEKLLIRDHLQFERELPAKLMFRGDKIGQYFLDFLIDGKVIVELKTVSAFRPDDFKQVLSYLRITGLELGIIVNFKGPKLIFKRVLNSKGRHP